MPATTLGAGYKTKRHSSKAKRGGNQDLSEADKQMQAQYEELMQKYANRGTPGRPYMPQVPERPPPSFLQQAEDYMRYQLGLDPRRHPLLGKGRRRKQKRGGDGAYVSNLPLLPDIPAEKRRLDRV